MPGGISYAPLTQLLRHLAKMGDAAAVERMVSGAVRMAIDCVFLVMPSRGSCVNLR